ncbi:MAG: hypothetical protein RI996_116 [Candidatus Parcubacteria bacterium]|jgi:FkbM family methyltransferase
MITFLKQTLRKYLPKQFFVFLSILFVVVFLKNKNIQRIKKYASFTEKQFIPVKISDTSFEILIDPDNGGVDFEIYADGVYEPEILHVIKSLLERKNNSVFLDVGANIGQHSLFASRFAQKVFAFEPIPKLFTQFTDSIYKNKFYNIFLCRIALGDRSMTSHIHTNNQNMGASSLVSHTGDTQGVFVQIERFDDISEQLGIHSVDVVKMDVEGFEYESLQGMQKMITKCHPSFVFEFSPHLYSTKERGFEIYSFFIENGYRLFLITKEGTFSEQVTDFSQLETIFQTNLIAEYIGNNTTDIC